MSLLEVSVDNGQYVVIMEPDGRLHALRHGQEWRDCTGDQLVYMMALELDKLRTSTTPPPPDKTLEELEETADAICVKVNLGGYVEDLRDYIMRALQSATASQQREVEELREFYKANYAEVAERNEELSAQLRTEQERVKELEATLGNVKWFLEAVRQADLKNLSSHYNMLAGRLMDECVTPALSTPPSGQSLA